MIGSLLFHPVVAAALWRAWAQAGAQPARRGFGLPAIQIDGRRAPLHWSEQELSPFAVLSRVRRADLASDRAVLVVPPLAGGYPFVLRDVVAALAAHAEVHVIEWINPRCAPSDAGGFAIDEQIEAIRAAVELIERRCHMLALCQAGPATFIAAADLAATRPRAAPISLSLIASPIDVMAAPSMLSEKLRGHRLEFYHDQLAIRATADGGERLVYPAERHLPLLISMLAGQSPRRDEFARLILDSINADVAASGGVAAPRFLEMVTSYMDLTGEFFLEMIERVYLAPEGPAAGMKWRGRPIDPQALGEVAIFVVEGGGDRIAAPGQTRPALDLTPAAGDAPRRAMLEPEAGHFGLFHGPRWRGAVAPWLDAALTEAEAVLGPY